MSKKLSQSEIDALVASLITGDSSAAGQPATPAPPPTAAAAEHSPAVGGFESIIDLGPVTEEEVENALLAYRNQKAGMAPPSLAVPALVPPPAGSCAAPPQAAGQAQAAGQEQAAGQVQAAGQMHSAARAPGRSAGAGARVSAASLHGPLLDIELPVSVELGRARLSLSAVLALGPGSVITLEKLANAPVDVLVNGKPIMKAEVLAIGEKYGVRITQSSLNVKAAS